MFVYVCIMYYVCTYEYVCMHYVCTFVYVCMYVLCTMYVCMYVHVCMYVCMCNIMYYVCMYMYVCIMYYVCMYYVCICMYYVLCMYVYIVWMYVLCTMYVCVCMYCMNVCIASTVYFFTYLFTCKYSYIYIVWAGYLSRYTDWLRVGRFGIESRWGWDFPPVQTGPGDHPASCKMVFPGGKVRPGRVADHSPHQVPRS